MSSVSVQLVALDAAAQALAAVADSVALAGQLTEEALPGLVAAVPGSAGHLLLVDRTAGAALSVLAAECHAISAGVASAAEGYRRLDADLVDALSRATRLGSVPG
ncbi:hypothetical protein BH20ACT5_BH20ACT5_23130 [soil metagenome]